MEAYRDNSKLQAAVSLAGTLATVALNAAASRLGLPAGSPAVASTSSASLNGIAALAQAYVGSTTVAANVAQGAGTGPVASIIGQQVQAKLPSVIDQKTVNAVFAAAQLVQP